MSGQVLLIDAGNTNVKWCLADPSGYGEVCSLSHIGGDLEINLAAQWGCLSRPDRVYLASVAGADVENQLRRWLHSHWSQHPEQLRAPASALGVTNAYLETPGNLGIDRWLTLLAAHSRNLGNCCIVDAGTAITIDLLDGNGRHHGGLILPGLKLMGDSLLQRTHIPRVAPDLEADLLARDTAGAVANAAYFSVVCLIERVMREAQEQFGNLPRLLLAGSDAQLLGKALEFPFTLEPELVVQGLYQLALQEGF